MSVARPHYLASGEPARLIPTFGETSKEQRTASIFLAAMMAVPAFAKKVLETINVRCGKTTKIEAYTEVTFNRRSKKTAFRPDGLLVVRTGKKEWRALVEAKSGNAHLSSDQLQTYVDIAKEFGIDALITVSNQLAVLPNHHPMQGQIRQPKSVKLFHWSWTYILTEATLLITGEEFDDPEQRFILSEVTRYLKHSSSGVSRFDRMSSEWKEMVASIQNHVPLQIDSTIVQKSVADWHQEQRDICLLMSRKVGQTVALKMSKHHSSDIDERFQSDCKLLALKHIAEFQMDVPNAAATVVVTADVARRNLTCSMSLEAPKDRKSMKARVNWLLRQVKSAKTNGVYIKANWSGRTPSAQLPLEKLLENPDSFSQFHTSKAAKSFEVLMTQDLGANFGRNTKFISILESFVPEFYYQIGQNLRSWKPSPPVIKEEKNAPDDKNAYLKNEPVASPNIGLSRQTANDLSLSAALAEKDDTLELPSFLHRNASAS